MDVEGLDQAIARVEHELLAATRAIAEVTQRDSMSGWLVEVLEKDSALARALGLPTAQAVARAVLTLLRVESELRQPLTTLLAQRTVAYTATLRDVYEHPLASEPVRALRDDIAVLEGLLDRYRLNYEKRKTIRLVAQALSSRQMHIFKVSAREPDLRVALRAFYEDADREDREAIDTLLQFVLEELRAEVKHAGHIRQPRHAWWALFTLVSAATPTWMTAHRADVNRAANELLQRGEYVPGRDIDYTSLVLESHSPENEDMWVAINALRILDSPNGRVLRRNTAEAIGRLAATAVDGLLRQPTTFSNLELAQSRLILLYEASNFRSLRYTLEVASKPSLTLRPMKVGTAFFEARVASAAGEIRSKVETFIRDPDQWTRPTLTSVIISGAPGQGKSELAGQLVWEFGRLATEAGMDFRRYAVSIGRDIKTAQDLDDQVLAVAARRDSKECVRAFIVDELDKASFDLFAPFLPVLEDPSGGPITIWVFAQSQASTFVDLKKHAENLPTKSLRDFLTRMQLGHLDVPHIRHAPEQKLCTLVGMARARNGSLARLDRDLVVDLLRRGGIDNNRDILRALTEDCEMREGRLILKSDPLRRLADYPVRRPRSESLRLIF